MDNEHRPIRKHGVPTKRRPHANPVVDLYINSYATPVYFLKTLLTMPEAVSDPKVRAIVYLREAAVELRSVEEALAEAEKAYHYPSDVDLHIMLILFWARTLSYSDTRNPRVREQIYLLCKQARSLLTPHTPPELTAWVLYLEAYISLEQGNAAGYEKLSAEALSLLSNSPHYAGLVLYHALALMEQGMAAQLEFEFGFSLKDFETLCPASEQGSTLDKRVRLGFFLNSVLTGDLVQAREQLPQVEHLDPSITAFYTKKFQVCRRLLELMENQQGSLTAAAPEPEASAGAQWLASTQYLLARTPAKALEAARAFAQEEPRLIAASLGFEGYCLIRAELAAGNWEPAKRLLYERQKRGCKHYLDSLFQARIELLANNNHIAAHHFAVLKREVERYKAKGRLDFEIQLACEISPTSLIELTLNAEKSHIGSKPQPASAAEDKKPGRSGIDRLIFSSQEMAEVCNRVMNFAAQDVPVLITGETGTGKELIAQALHESGPRSSKPFLAINCGSISETLIESELFGHTRGAFTGADKSQPGLFREAGEGTIFLDEIGDISPKLQVSLLRVLETGEIRPVGSADKHKVKCRIIAATNANLDQLAAEGRFRQDLVYRLKRLEIYIPPLRERPTDIITLAQHFFNEGRPSGVLASMSGALQEAFFNYQWPGNVRELRNVIERLRLLNSDKLSYEAKDLEPTMLQVFDMAKRNAAPPPAARFHSPAAAPSAPVARPEQPVFQAADDVSSGREEEPRGAANSYAEIKKLLGEGRSSLRQMQKLRDVFLQFKELQVGEAAAILAVSRVTASRYLQKLAGEGFIERVEPTASTRTHYYRRKT